MDLINQIKGWLADLADKDQLWIVHAFGLVVVTLVVAMAVVFVLRRAEHRADKANAMWAKSLFWAARSPVRGLIWLVGLSWASYVTHRGTEVELMGVVTTAREVGIVAMAAWFLVRFIRMAEREFLNPRDGEPRDPTTVLAIGKLLRVAVLITAVLVVAQSLGYSMSGVLAFGGVGGLAVGFAAKDLLANFFGGLMVYMDRPFAVGEWVRSPDQNIEGTVENIGWRLTRIRTFDRRPLYVPNATFTQISVENPSRMENRRIFETVGIRYDDAGKMAGIVADVKQMVLDHPDLETEVRTLIVNFNGFAASSLDFFVYTFTKTVDWVEFHEIKQDVMLKVIEIVESHGAQCAFPTSTLHIPEPVTLAGSQGAQDSRPENRDSAQQSADNSRQSTDKSQEKEGNSAKNSSSIQTGPDNGGSGES